MIPSSEAEAMRAWGLFARVWSPKPSNAVGIRDFVAVAPFLALIVFSLMVLGRIWL